MWPAANLAALAVGLFPHLASPGATATAALPALRTLIVGQVSFALVVYPLLLIRRGQRSAWLDVAELALWAAMAAPFAIVAAYMSDAAAADVVRAALMTLAAFVAGWCLGRFALTVEWAGSIVVVIGLVAVVAGPMLVYIVWEFGGADTPPVWLSAMCPTTLAWSVAESRQGGWIPSPVWAWLLWPLAAAAMTSTAVCRRGSEEEATYDG